MNKKIGFIGCGNMGGALAIACAKSIGGDRVLLSDLSEKTLRIACERSGGTPMPTDQLVKEADILVLAVKPQVYAAVIGQIAPLFCRRASKPLIISIAAGVTVARVRAMGVGEDCPIIRIMPNTPASVGEGMILYTCDRTERQDEEDFLSAFAAAGRLCPLPEDKIDAASALSGCGPAFVCLFAEAMADGAVACGLPRAQANLFAAQTLLGTAKLMIEAESHPGVLKDAVCSPGGTTIQGVRRLEEGGMRGTVMDAVIAAYEKTLALKKGADQ